VLYFKQKKASFDMTILEFQEKRESKKIDLIGGYNNGTTANNLVSSEIAFLRYFWQKVSSDIAPHYYGSMPSAIEKAFPNEKIEQTNYRREVHQSATQDYLKKAITDTSRIIMSSEFMPYFGDALALWGSRNPTPYNDHSLLEYLSTELYPIRALDPNGYIAVLPDNVSDLTETSQGNFETIAKQNGEDFAVKIKYYPSLDLVYQDDDMMIFREPIIVESMVVANPVSKLCYRILTKDSSFLYDPSGTSVPEMYKEFFRQEGRNFITAAILGGSKKIIRARDSGLILSYFDSDFSYAVPAMNYLELVSNQHLVITTNSVFPITMSRLIPCPEKGCNDGKIAARDNVGSIVVDEFGAAILHTCKKCNGTGKFDIYTMDAMVVPSGLMMDDAGKPLSLTDYFAQVSPDTDAVKELGEQKQKATEKVQQALSIVMQKQVGQTADSKEADMEDKYTFLFNIALSMSRLCTHILKSTAYLVLDKSLWAAEIPQIKTSTPKTFSIVSLEALRAMRDLNREGKSLDIRAQESLKVLEKETDNPEKIKALEWLHEYTQFRNEATNNELRSWTAAQVISPKEYKEALFAGAEIQKAMYANPNITKEQTFALLQKIFASTTNNSDIATQLRTIANPPNTI
jgi:hypothetical protein